jgi:hypothetical protein
MQKKLLSTALLVIMSLSAIQSQNSSGKCWYIDYQQWNINTPALHILCGNNQMLNLGGEMTIEFWVRAYTFGENRKVLGKVSSDGSSFNNGYVMGYQNLNVYTEIWNPSTQVIPYGSAGPMQVDSAFVHLASTYSSSTGKLRDFINGNLVGEVQIFPANPISSNSAQLLIGAAPWDPFAYQFYGALDEVRLWNVAHTGAQIKERMFKELRGNEAGLVAYYNFNTAQGVTVPDMSGNANHGTLQNADDNCWSWAQSDAPVGSPLMYNMLQLVAAWSGKQGNEFNYAITDNGFSVIAEIGRKEFRKYVVFGHTGATGVSTANAPVGSPSDFKRTSREWYLNQAGGVILDVFVNLTQAAGGGEALPSGQATGKYVLLYRPNQTAAYTAIAYPNTVYADNLIINDKRLADGYYAVGYSAQGIVVGLDEPEFSTIRIYPNPAKTHLNVENVQNALLTLRDLAGRKILIVRSENQSEKIDISSLPAGVYLLEINMVGKIQTQKCIVHP